MSTFIIIVTVQLQNTGPFVSEVPTSKGTPTIPPSTKPEDLDAAGSSGRGTPLLTAMLSSGKWSIQSVQQLGQPTNGSQVNLFLLVSSS